MNKIFNMVFVRPWVFENGRTEDGELRTAKAWNIYVGNEFGQRLVHTVSGFTNIDPEGFEKAEQFAKRVQAHIDAGGELNLDHWHEVDPAYGSPAYVQFGTELSILEWEREQDAISW